MALGLSTSCRPGLTAAALGQLAELAERSGVAGWLLDARLAGMSRESRALGDWLGRQRDRCPVWAIEAPCAGLRAAQPELTALDRDEAQAALKLAELAIDLAADLGAHQIVLRLGEVRGLTGSWPRVRRAHLRGELGDVARQVLREERERLAPRHVDSARRGLESLARRAETAGLLVGLRNAGRLLGLPSPSELAELLGDFAGAPLVPLLDLGAMHLTEVMGFSTVQATVEAWRGGPLALLGDACGPIAGLPPGRGEIDLRKALGVLEKTERFVFQPWSGLSPDEVAAGMAGFRRLCAGRSTGL